MVGVYNKRTHSLQLVESPMHIVPCEVTALKVLGASSTVHDPANWQADRKSLGQMFGNAKALKQIREQERRQIDVNVIDGVAGHLQDSIIDATMGLPAQGERAAVASWNDQSIFSFRTGAAVAGEDTMRTIPPHDLTALTPRDAYPLYDVVPRPELDAIDPTDMVEAPADEKIKQLPRYTPWAERLLRTWSQEKRSTSRED